ncbi:hypothetical protein [Streptomyces sp. NPDC059743]|uniref:hypothetical protein n=1 Tax=Streptomyces sp. NPDC059743 TaxID=3346928 RepID=UPI00364963C2
MPSTAQPIAIGLEELADDLALLPGDLATELAQPAARSSTAEAAPLEHVVQVPFLVDEDPVGALGADGGDEPLGGGVNRVKIVAVGAE